ncbi:MAG: NAD(P)/FAD-dependent oxidoreductase [Planctomycetes bacterium]|nr:NAD(P)/FAD-dependent oxidoreductase [Planctomycetota bacterium]
MHDAIIIGGGHNGLVCAACLARAGWKVLVLERRPFVGGACVTEELWPGYRVSTAAYVVSLLLPEVERELELARHGYRVLPRNPSSFTPLEDGRSLTLGPDAAENRREIAKFSARDAEAFPRYEAFLTRVAERLEPVLSSTPPDLLPLPQSWRRSGWRKRFGDLKRTWGLYDAVRSLGDELPEAIELLIGPARTILDRWFESEVLKATLATDAIIGTFQPPSAPGTGYVLLHHVMGAAGGARGVWGYVEGGMGALTQAIARSAEAAGAEIRCEAAVERILVDGGRAVGVRLAGGETIAAKRIASGVDANVTFLKLLEAQTVPDGFRRAIERIDYSSASAKINLAVRELPQFLCVGERAGTLDRSEPGPEHRGTIHIGASLDDIEQAWADARCGRPSDKPVVEMTIPSAVDSTLTPAGRHVVSLFVQYAPYEPTGATWDELRDPFADRCLAAIGRLAPNFLDAVVHRQVLVPPDLEHVFGLTGGNIFQGAMSPGQLFSLRPVPGWSDYRTPVRGLYLCGSATHPGGGVTGACGRNAAREMLRDGR